MFDVDLLKTEDILPTRKNKTGINNNSKVWLKNESSTLVKQGQQKEKWLITL